MYSKAVSKGCRGGRTGRNRRLTIGEWGYRLATGYNCKAGAKAWGYVLGVGRKKGKGWWQLVGDVEAADESMYIGT
ncbi:hypothetical protein Droror1_Dr00025158 [Drosera rotundifolia]